VIGTPLIDPATGTIYAVSKSVIASGPTFFQRIHALDSGTGTEKFSGPVAIAASVSGTGSGSSGGNLAFDAQLENHRPGLALVNGVVYISWASHEDAGLYHGWIVGYNAATLSQVAVFNDTPDGDRGGIWMSGGAPAADSANNLFVITGNGTYDGTSAFGDSFLINGFRLVYAGGPGIAGGGRYGLWCRRSSHAARPHRGSCDASSHRRRQGRQPVPCESGQPLKGQRDGSGGPEI
jgi:hypothetical protein